MECRYRGRSPGCRDGHLGEGTSFCISLPSGDINPDHPHGLFFQDTRILSAWSLTVNGQSVEPLTAQTKEPYRAVFAGRITLPDGYADTPLIVERTRELGFGWWNTSPCATTR